MPSFDFPIGGVISAKPEVRAMQAAFEKLARDDGEARDALNDGRLTWAQYEAAKSRHYDVYRATCDAAEAALSGHRSAA